MLGYQHFRLLIIEECHLVANVHKVQGKCLLAAVHRMKAKLLLLTGTPLQNELKELGYPVSYTHLTLPTILLV